MRKENKAVVIEQLKGYLSEYPHFYFTSTEGMNALQTAELRRKANATGIKVLVVKNTLLRRALSETETDFAPLYSALKGNTTVLFAQVANAPAKLIKEIIKEKKDKANIILKGAYAETGIYGADQLDTLVSIKSKEELVADVIALLQSPIRNVLSALENKDKSEEVAAE